jgi:hypothetical protein
MMLAFCRQIDQKLIDRNMTAESVFKNIIYLNEFNEWTQLDRSLVEPFLFMHLKCFRIRIDQEYDRRHFHFSTHSQLLKVLKVNFTETAKKSPPVYLMTKANETTEFSNIGNLYFVYNQKYSAEQSILTIKYEDRLGFIKRYLSASDEDVFSDSDRQFISQVHNVNQLKISDGYGFSSQLIFSLSLVKKTLSARNEAKFLLGLLNVLFWFDLSILDLHPLFVYLYDYLLVYLYLHLPVYLLGKLNQFLLFLLFTCSSAFS